MKKSKPKEFLVSLSLDFSTTLRDCLTRFFKKEELRDLLDCSFCKKKTKHLRKFKLKKTSNILILHLKRFKMFKNVFNKIDNEIESDDILEIKTGTYNLKGFIIHKGTLNYGHYIACLIIDGKCYCFDDEKVNLVNLYEYKKQAYMFFFEKK